MKLNIFENGVLIGEDSKDKFDNWTHRWYDYGSKQFKKQVHQGRMINLYYSKWEYKEVTT